MTRNKKVQALLFVLTAALIAFAPSRPVAGQAQSVPTFSKDVAPILQRSCQTCHRPNSVAPMSLLTYEEVRPWARAIKQRTGLGTKMGVMPPWFIDKSIGIQDYKDDFSLSPKEIATVAAWVDAARREGIRRTCLRRSSSPPTSGRSASPTWSSIRAGHDESQRAGLVGRAGADAARPDRGPLRLGRGVQGGQQSERRDGRQVHLPSRHSRDHRREGPPRRRRGRGAARSRPQRGVVRPAGRPAPEGRLADRVSLDSHARDQRGYDCPSSRRVQVPPQGIQAPAAATGSRSGTASSISVRWKPARKCTSTTRCSSTRSSRPSSPICMRPA